MQVRLDEKTVYEKTVKDGDCPAVVNPKICGDFSRFGLGLMFPAC
jgi:hypothetical protein